MSGEIDTAVRAAPRTPQQGWLGIRASPRVTTATASMFFSLRLMTVVCF
jgi:hypothetical protein